MLQGFTAMLNNILMLAYHNILRVEEEFLQNNNRISLTIREMHLVECVGEGDRTGRTISEIADYLKIARPSVTVAVKKLEHRGYLQKNTCENDGRVVRVTLTREGRAIFMYHKRYHLAMVGEIEEELDESEKQLLIGAITKLNKFFEKSIGAAT